MGEIPERGLFLQKELNAYLKPYEALAFAVRSGELGQFQQVENKYRDVFTADGTLTLVKRLHYNVIKVGLRSINVSYSKISLKDICTKLGLESEEDAAGICGKAIADGVIHAVLDYENRCLVSKGSRDIYSTSEPQDGLHKRIAFCLQLRNDCTKNMEYPQKKAKVVTDEDPSAAARELDEALKEIEEDDDIDML